MLQPPSAGHQASDAQILRFTFSRRLEDPRTQWLIAVYREVLSRLSLGFQFVDVPPARATLLVESGQADGELGRTWGYGDLHPNLLRVPEPNNEVQFAAYVTSNRLGDNVPAWGRIRALGLVCEHRHGIQELSELLARHLNPMQISKVITIEQGIRRLQLARTDIYFDVREGVEDYLAFGDASAAARAGPKPRLLGIVQTTTGHAYLHRRHAPRLAAISQTLRELKQEGFVERYRLQMVEQYLASKRR
ncbi:hypothetical protein OU995_21155 [Roseateles sp. SL47]|uniref:hypothetical protein n=1 Tax=Roseateles sp. SL47 TaxID=2995138 RepID=UPI002270092F|nr:hypothetical protein [Roseateles sp. SL47]WAC72054.1 hypothetical protein OU995_21155 [Roseateles sp. SL47]